MSQIIFNTDGTIACSRCGKIGFESKSKAYGHTGACRDRIKPSEQEIQVSPSKSPNKPSKLKQLDLRPPMITRLKKVVAEQDDINLVDFNMPMSNGKPTQKLKNILETNVSDSYYIGKAVVEVMVAQSEFKETMVSIKTGKNGHIKGVE